MTEVVEGLATAPAALKLAQKHQMQAPIIEAVMAVLTGAVEAPLPAVMALAVLTSMPKVSGRPRMPLDFHHAADAGGCVRGICRPGHWLGNQAWPVSYAQALSAGSGCSRLLLRSRERSTRLPPTLNVVVGPQPLRKRAGAAAMTRPRLRSRAARYSDQQPCDELSARYATLLKLGHLFMISASIHSIVSCRSGVQQLRLIRRKIHE